MPCQTHNNSALEECVLTQAMNFVTHAYLRRMISREPRCRSYRELTLHRIVEIHCSIANNTQCGNCENVFLDHFWIMIGHGKHTGGNMPRDSVKAKLAVCLSARKQRHRCSPSFLVFSSAFLLSFRFAVTSQCVTTKWSGKGETTKRNQEAKPLTRKAKRLLLKEKRGEPTN